MNSPEARIAARACKSLLPNAGSPPAAQLAKAQEAMLKYAQCMRSHGVTKFPDPKPGGALVIGPKVGVNPNTPAFKAAQQTCQKVAPSGVHVSGPHGSTG